MTSDPWKDLPWSSDASALMGTRVAAHGRWDFFWARDLQGRYVWAMDLHSSPPPRGPIPNLRGVEVRVVAPAIGTSGHLILTLLDTSAVDLFARLCDDVMESTSGARDQTDAAARALARTWRWHHLLRGAGAGLLLGHQQQGLLGELIILEGAVSRALGLGPAIDSWRGPLGSPKDFELGLSAIEVKTRRGLATPFVVISSEHQLDDRSCDALYLAVVDVQPSTEQAGGARRLGDVAGSIQEEVARSRPDVLDLFESRLTAAGFRWEDDYSDVWWLVKGPEFYRVGPEFPRIVTGDIPMGVSDVSYTLSLSAIDGSRISVDDAIEEIRKLDG